jgi:hypothetical protein
MALLAGKVAHECFAAARVWSLRYHQQLPKHYEAEGNRLFGRDRFAALHTAAETGIKQADRQASLRNIVLECLATSNFVESPDDRRRTYSNLEASLLYYVQRWDYARYPVWVEDSDSGECTPTGRHTPTGIERSFAIHISCTDGGFAPFLYTGRIDGIHYDPKQDRLLVMENKTASRLNDAWRMSYHTSPQVTGYCIAASILTKKRVNRAAVVGLSLPLPRTMAEGFTIEMVDRCDTQHVHWMQWLLYAVSLHDKYYDAPLEAPKHYQSCNRYFRPCPLIPLCASPEDEAQQMYESLRREEWNPLHEDTDT